MRDVGSHPGISDEGEANSKIVEKAKDLVTKQTDKWMKKLLQASEDKILTPDEQKSADRVERLLEPARKKRARTAAQPSRAHATADKDRGELQTQAARARRVFFSVSCASKIVPDGCHATSQTRKADMILVHDLADVQRELLAHTVCILRGRQLQTSDSEGDQYIKFERGNETRKMGIHVSTNFESQHPQVAAEIHHACQGTWDKHWKSGWRSFLSLQAWEKWRDEHPTQALSVWRSGDLEKRRSSGEASCCVSVAAFLRHVARAHP